MTIWSESRLFSRTFVLRSTHFWSSKRSADLVSLSSRFSYSFLRCMDFESRIGKTRIKRIGYWKVSNEVGKLSAVQLQLLGIFPISYFLISYWTIQHKTSQFSIFPTHLSNFINLIKLIIIYNSVIIDWINFFNL